MESVFEKGRLEGLLPLKIGGKKNEETEEIHTTGWFTRRS